MCLRGADVSQGLPGMAGRAARLEALTGVPCVAGGQAWCTVHPRGWEGLSAPSCRVRREHSGRPLRGHRGPPWQHRPMATLWGGSPRGNAAGRAPRWGSLVWRRPAPVQATPGQAGKDEGNWSSSASTLWCVAFLILGSGCHGNRKWFCVKYSSCSSFAVPCGQECVLL